MAFSGWRWYIVGGGLEGGWPLVFGMQGSGCVCGYECVGVCGRERVGGCGHERVDLVR